MDTTMELPNGTADSSRRRSGRVSRRPDMFAEEEHSGSIVQNGSAKRKRVVDGTADNADEEDEPSDEDEDESEPDEEEIKEKRRAQKKRPKTAKPVAKKIKTNAGTTLAIRSANGPSRPANKAARLQKARARQSQAHKEGLYAEVFGKGQDAAEAADLWLSSVRADSVAAIRDLVNFVFECIGCEVKIASSDIEDIDNVPSKLGDVLEEHYSQNQSAEYPLISKAKQYSEFKTILTDFFRAVFWALHHSSMLYDLQEIHDNIHVWVGTMSGAQYRPFRHTSTVITLAISSTQCEIASGLQSDLTTSKTQLETEKKKKNKKRIAAVQETIRDYEKKIAIVDDNLKDAFDTVYVHRYRDVDEKIRVECVSALGSWINTYRKMFLEGQYLRYLGWVMSDPNSATRLEVVKQLKLLYSHKRHVAPLRAFTDRFRPRMVEMGARDADVSVRVEAIEMLDKLRNYELLEPDDIDTLGRLIFDAEPRVRKTVGKFFVSNIEDLYGAMVEDWDDEQYKEALPSVEEADDPMAASQAWIKFKCLAQTLSSYDARSESSGSPEDNIRTLANTEDADSRYMLATRSIYPHMKALSHWESLAGYLLFDHSSITAPSDDDDVSLAVQGTYKLVGGEETILLDVLYYSVKMYLTAVLELAHAKKGGRTNATKDSIREKQETAAHSLSTFIPQLLSRYGSTPRAAASILRLEQLLDADLISDLQGGEATYSALLDDINNQFVSHSDRKVLAEASRAFRVARSFEQSKDAATAKVQEMWTDLLASLQSLLKGKNIDTRGTLERNILQELVNICIRAVNLATVADCSDILEQKFAGQKKGKGRAGGWENDTILELLMKLVLHGVSDADTVEDVAEMEDQLCTAAVTTLSFYFRWKIVTLKSAIEANDSRFLSPNALVDLGIKRANFAEALTPVITGRLPLDPVRVTCVLTTLDLFTLFATTKHLAPESGRGDLDDGIAANLATLSVPIPTELLAEILATFERSEKSFARKTNRKILEPKKAGGKKSASRAGTAEPTAEQTQEEIEKPPEDSDGELESSDEGESSEDDGERPRQVEDGGRGKEARRQAALLAEQGLCEVASKIVLAVIGGVVGVAEGKKVKERLGLNRGRLGKSFAGVVAYLDEKKEKGKGGKKDVVKGGPKKGSVKSKERVAVGDDEDDEDEGPERMDLEEDPVLDVDDVVEEDGRDNVEREIEEEEEREREDREAEEARDREREGVDEDDDEVMGD